MKTRRQPVLRKRLRLSLAGSLFFHALILLALLFCWIQVPAPALKSARKSGPIAVGIRTAPMEAKTDARSKNQKSAEKLKKQARSNGLSAPSRARPGLNFGLAPSHAQNGMEHGSGEGGGNGRSNGEDGYEVANGMGIEEETKLYPFFSALWKKIDASTGYPDDFVRQRMTGYVTAQVVVDHRGVFTGRIVKVNSDHPILRTYTMAVLFHALSEPLPQKLWSGRDRMTLVAHFDFHTFTYGQVPPERVQRELKNVLEFERYGYTDPKLKQNLEKWMSKYMPPIIPIPGGIAIDLIRTYQLLSNIGKNKLDADDLRLERIDLKREQWESVLRKTAASNDSASGSATKAQ